MRELTEAIAYMTDVKGLEGSEKEWWDEMKRDITGLRGSIEALAEKGLETSKGRIETVNAIENILNHIKVEVYSVDHVNRSYRQKNPGQAWCASCFASPQV